MRILVSGWFSFQGMGTTAGDIISKDILCDWLRAENIAFDVALAPSYNCSEGVDWQKVDPLRYTDVIFVCGPFGNGWPLTEFLSYFSGSRLIGVNLSLLESLETWNPFTLLYERDSSINANPDITLNGEASRVPVIGVILAHKQKEYKEKSLHENVNIVIERMLNTLEASIVPIDTALDNNSAGLRTPGEIEALIARMDVVITTRLHGTVLALKNGVPVIPIDPIKGGAKISRQVKTLEWPLLFNAERLDEKDLSAALVFCLTEEARQKAKECAQKGKVKIEQIRINMMNQLLILKNECLYEQ